MHSIRKTRIQSTWHSAMPRMLSFKLSVRQSVSVIAVVWNSLMEWKWCADVLCGTYSPVR